MFQISKFKELSFLVYGLGISGISVVKFLQNKKIKKFQVWDDKQKNLFINYKVSNLNKALKTVDFIILSPGISLFKRKNLTKFKKKIITDIDLFFLFKNKSKTIVVTGTNGKSTTCKLLAHLLKKNKIKFTLGGNIGTPILTKVNSKKNYVIIEASSFQLSHSQFIRPDFAFLLNFTNDHLDWHGNLNHYLNSKLKVFNHQTKNDFAIVNNSIKKIFKKKGFKSKLIIPRINDYKNIKNKIKNEYLSLNINDENMSNVFTFAKLLKIKEKSFIKSMKSFKGLSHRFEIFLNKKGIKFINDSKATSFVATRSALQSLKNIYWILGGLNKKGDKIDLFKVKKNIKKCYLIGKNTSFFKQRINNKINFHVTKNLKNSLIQILKDIKTEDHVEKTILLSPAAASFDQFKNFEDRGNQFKKLCKKYAKQLT